MKLKVLHLINDLAIGGAEKLLIDSIPLQKEMGIDVSLALLKNSNTEFYELLRIKNCCEIYSLDAKSIYNPLIIFKLNKLFKHFDIVHVHLFPSQYLAAFTRFFFLMRGVKFVFTEHSTTNRRLGSKFWEVIDKFVYRRYEKIICISDGVESALVKHLDIDKRKLSVVNNGVNIAELTSKSLEYNKIDFGFDHDDKLLIMIAGFRYQKYQDVIIRALKHLPYNVKLLLVGDGVRRIECEELAVHEKVTDRVCFLGNRFDTVPLYKMCDIAIMASHIEGFGLAAVEALATKIPLIASDIEGLSEIVGGAALLFDNSVKELVENIELILNNKKLRNEMAINGSLRALKYSLTNTVQKQIELYYSI